MLTADQIQILRAMIDRILPADDFPSGWDAGVGTYLTRQFDRDLRDALPVYRAGLDALNLEATAAYGTSFAALDALSQDTLLAHVENGTVQAAWEVDPASFFRMAVQHAMEGYYGDPGNGGNLNRIAWQMIGFEVTA
jgi:hypothetical protein